MTATILDGRATREAIFDDLTGRVAALKDRGVVPGLGTVLIGDDPGSHSYVRGKHNACAKVGIRSIRRDLPAHATQRPPFEDMSPDLQRRFLATDYLIRLEPPWGGGAIECDWVPHETAI